MREWAGCCSGVCGNPGSLFFCASSLLCFSMNGSFRIGSEASAHADWVFISAIRRVQDSKCNLLRIAVVPNVDWVSKTASANLVNSSSETGFCGLPKAKASVEKEPMFWPCSFSKSPSCSSSHRFWKAFSESMRAIATKSQNCAESTIWKGLILFVLGWSHGTRKHSQLITSKEELQIAQTGHLPSCWQLTKKRSDHVALTNYGWHEILNKIGKSFVFLPSWLARRFVMHVTTDWTKKTRGSLIPHFLPQSEVSGVFEARQQWLQQGVSHLRDAGGL